MLWAGRKAVDFGVPRQTPHTALVEARHAAWRADAVRSPWRDPVALAAPACACACMGARLAPKAREGVESSGMVLLCAWRLHCMRSAWTTFAKRVLLMQGDDGIRGGPSGAGGCRRSHRGAAKGWPLHPPL